jgi:hypothetical protein
LGVAVNVFVDGVVGDADGARTDFADADFAVVYQPVDGAPADIEALSGLRDGEHGQPRVFFRMA